MVIMLEYVVCWIYYCRGWWSREVDVKVGLKKFDVLGLFQEGGGERDRI